MVRLVPGRIGSSCFQARQRLLHLMEGDVIFSSLMSGRLLGLISLCLILVLAACGSTPAGKGQAATATVPPTTIVSPSATPGGPTLSSALVTYRGHAGIVVMASWSPDGKRIASCGNDATVQVWGATTGHQFWTYTFPNPRTSYTFAVAWSPDGKRIAAGGNTGMVAILDAATGHLLTTYDSQSTFIEGIAWSPDSKRVAFGDGDHTVEVWDATAGKKLVTYKGHSAEVQRIAWSPDGTRIASASYDGTVQVWNAMTGHHLLTYNGQGAPVWSVAWSPDGKRIVSGSGAAGLDGPVTANNSAKVWDVATGQTLLTYTEQGSKNEVYGLGWSPDGKEIASGGDDMMVRIWDTTTGQTMLVCKGHTDIIFSVAWSPDGKEIASASADNSVKVWRWG